MNLGITDAEKCKQSIFQPSPTGKQPEFYYKHTYDWYVMSPYCEGITNPLGIPDEAEGFEWSVQTQDFNEPMKHLTKADVLTNVVKDVLAGTRPDLPLYHKGTLMKFTMVNE